jgi:hypothetical protein
MAKIPPPTIPVIYNITKEAFLFYYVDRKNKLYNLIHDTQRGRATPNDWEVLEHYERQIETLEK